MHLTEIVVYMLKGFFKVHLRELYITRLTGFNDVRLRGTPSKKVAYRKILLEVASGKLLEHHLLCLTQ
jgi:hypothetical protein